MSVSRNMLLAGVLLSTGALCSQTSNEISPAAALGKKIFFDSSLSASGKMSCATCHDPRYAYGPPNGLAVQLGGPDGKHPGTRAVPSLRYILNRTPQWTHVLAYSRVEQLTEADDAPAGGFDWDGRFNSLHEQAMFPLFDQDEMANTSAETLAKKLSQSQYADAFRTLFGEHIFDTPKAAVDKAALALEHFEMEDKSFHPYSSKFDAWMNGKATLTAQELHGKQLFDDPDKGNCSSCHIDQQGANGTHPIFTDFQFEALGAPRNAEIPANKNPKYYDLGLCGPLRTDAASKDSANCGLFKTPTLRNTAIRRTFFHNGSFHSLREVLHFYVERDTNPEKWYPVGPGGKPIKFDDLPLRDRKNVDVIDAPLDRKPGDAPAWNAQEIEDVIAFLKTLNDDDVLAGQETTTPTMKVNPSHAK